ncbi:MAG: ISNCY family transposase [Chloroflexi bacterium]|nr:ISNCY family transposase [Chloroflexota bacterium]
MNQKEQQRVMVLNRLERGELVGREAAGLMSLSLRQVWRLLAAYREEGVAAMAHGNRGRRPVHGVGEEVRKIVVALAQGPYAGCNHYHLTDLLVEREGLALSRSTVRRILVAAGLKSPRRRRSPKHRCRRERYPQEGMLLQVDGSRHDWLEGRGPYLTLVGAIDDATGTVPSALFREQEDAQGYFLLMEEIIRSKGIPLALYSDRHSIFQVNPKQRETLEEQLAGERQPTQMGRALRELGVQAIFALSPQAKGSSPAGPGLSTASTRSMLRWSPVLQIPAHGGQGQHRALRRADPSAPAEPGAPGLCPRSGGGPGTAGRSPGGGLPGPGHCHHRGPTPGDGPASPQEYLQGSPSPSGEPQGRGEPQ